MPCGGGLLYSSGPPGPGKAGHVNPTNQAYTSYLATRVETATPGQLVLLLYDGGLRRLHQAQAALEQGDFETGHRHLLRVQDILTELIVALDTDSGGEIAANLHRLYDYMYRTLVQANLDRDVSRVREVAGLLSDLRGAWAQALQIGPKAEVPADNLPAGAERDAERDGHLAAPGSRLNIRG